MSDQPEGQTVETVSGMDKFCGCLSVAVAIVLTLFHLLAASPLLTLNNTSQAVIHGALIVSYFLLTKPMKWKKLSRPVDFLFIIITVIAAYEVIAMRNNNAASANLYSPFQQYISMVFVVVALIVAYRALGPVLPTLSLLFLVYTLIGRYLPGAFATAKVTMTRMGTYLMVSSEGLFGSALSTAANFIFLFVIFGSVLAFIGAGEFFVDISFAAFGKFCGGPAQAAVYSSMLMGMVNGSGAANVVTTGTFTIPLMKKTGFDKDTAGAIEAVASNGGQIMPPVMGAVAFLMADATSLPYTTICLAALMPAVMYYLTLSVSIFSYSHKNHIPVKAPDPDAPTVWQIFKKGWFYFLPIVALIGLMTMGLSTQRSALLTIILCVVIGLLTNPKKFTPQNLKQLCVDSAKSIMTVSIACMIAGVIVGAINITGLGLRILRPHHRSVRRQGFRHGHPDGHRLYPAGHGPAYLRLLYCAGGAGGPRHGEPGCGYGVCPYVHPVLWCSGGHYPACGPGGLRGHRHFRRRYVEDRSAVHQAGGGGLRDPLHFPLQYRASLLRQRHGYLCPDPFGDPVRGHGPYRLRFYGPVPLRLDGPGPESP